MHPESAKEADKQFYSHLKESTFSKVILMNGGTASGKTEFLVTQLVDEEVIILDTTMPTIEGAKIKIKAILKAQKTTIVYSVIPDDLRRAFTAFLHRDRKFSDDHFYRTHSTSRNTLLWLAESYPKVELNIIESSYSQKEGIVFSKIEFNSNEEKLSYLKSIQISENDIISQIQR